MNKFLSLIIPTYNMEAYLDKCLASLIVSDSNLLNQLEVLVINDGSKDRSSEIAHSYQERYPETFRVIDKENGNYGSCINRGLKEATGKYIKVLDADDWFDTSVLAEFVKCLSTVNVDLVISKCKVVKETDGSLYDYSNIDLFEQGVTYKFSEWSDRIADRMVMHNITYNRKIFSTIKYHQTTGISYTDTEWVFKPMQKVETFVFFDNFLYYYLRGREGQTMNPKLIQKKYTDLCTVALILAETYNNSPHTEAYRRFMERKMESYTHWMLFSCGMINDRKTAASLFQNIKDTAPNLYGTMKHWRYRQSGTMIEYMPLFEAPWSYIKYRITISGISETLKIIDTAAAAGILQTNTAIKALKLIRRIKRKICKTVKI